MLGGPLATVIDEHGAPVPGCVDVPVTGGAWSCVPTVGLTSSSHTLTAVATDQSGNKAASPAVPIVVNAVSPVITSPSDKSTGNTTTPVFSGTGAAEGDTVAISDGKSQICVATVKSDLSWTCSPSVPVKDGAYTLTVTETDAAGNLSAPSAEVAYTVDTLSPAAPTVDPTNGTQVSGTGADGYTVTVIDENGAPVPGCVDVPVAGGHYVCAPVVPVALGDHLSVSTTDSLGHESAPITVTVLAVEIDAQFAQRRTGDDQQIVGYNFNPGEAVHAVVNSTPLDLGTKTADSQGRVVFNFTVPEGFELGTHTANLTGAVSGAKSVTFDVIDVSPPIRVSTGGSVARPFQWLASASIFLVGAGALLVALRRKP